MHLMQATDPALRLTTAERLGYGLGDAACNVVFQFVLLFMPFFYTDVYGLSAAAMGTLFLVVRTVSAFFDPLMGLACDRTHTRWGKFRPYLAAMALPFGVTAVLTFTTPNLSPAGKLIYAYATYLALMAVYSAVNVPYCALGAAVTRDPEERIALNSYRYMLVTAIGAVMSFAAMPLVDRLGRGDPQAGFQRMMAVLAVLGVAMLLACFALTKERVTDPPAARTDLAGDLRALLQNDQWRVVAAINFVLFVALVIQDGLAVGYMTWFAGRKDLVKEFVAAGLISAMLGAASAAFIPRRVNKGTAYALIQTLAVVSLVAMYAIDRSQIAAMFAVYSAIEFFTKLASVLLWAMMADAVDYGEIVTGRRIAGLALAGSLLALKLGMALGGALLGWLLAYVGYQSAATSQSPAAVAGVAVLFTLVPAAGHAVLVLLATRYRLDHARCEAMRIELEQADARRSPPGVDFGVIQG
jgi:GPH family glycoside/pentoside/hexuronide:cation symporter